MASAGVLVSWPYGVNAVARNEQLIRQHKLLQILERYRFGRLLEELRDDLVEELGLSSLHVRTVRRDLEALQLAGVDVDVHEQDRGRAWKLGAGFRGSHKISASASELIALSLGRDLMLPLVGTPFWHGIETFWNKVREELPTSVWEHYEKYRRFLAVLGLPTKSYEEHQGMLKTINRAILEHRVVEIEYQSIGKPAAQRCIEPLGVIYFQSSLYILAVAQELSGTESPIRRFKLDRFRKAKALDEWFKPPEDFQLDDYLRQSTGIFSGQEPIEIAIKISTLAAPWVSEDPWHPEQQVQRHSDGSVTLTLPVVHELEVIPRVLALGGEAEVLSPESCRQIMARIVQQMACRYSPD